jgi:CheY-like chemotaxis protein
MTLRLRAHRRDRWDAFLPCRALPAPGEVGARVLVADDHPVSQQVLLGPLGVLRLIVDTAINGSAALSQWQPGRYAAVLADAHMLDRDGDTLTAEFRPP